VGAGAEAGGRAVCVALGFSQEGVRGGELIRCVSYRIEEMETKIAGGLIEEVIQVAEGELKLVDVMIENKV